MLKSSLEDSSNSSKNENNSYGIANVDSEGKKKRTVANKWSFELALQENRRKYREISLVKLFFPSAKCGRSHIRKFE